MRIQSHLFTSLLLITIAGWVTVSVRAAVAMEEPVDVAVPDPIHLSSSSSTSIMRATSLLTDEENLRRIDSWLKKNNLNEYGDPPDTMYMGGTPLFDESTGTFVDRLTYLLHKFPVFEDPTYYAEYSTTTDPTVDTPTTTIDEEPVYRCPCYGREDLFWAFNKMATLTVDIASDLSCENTSHLSQGDNSSAASDALRILFTDIDSANLLGRIYYNDLYVVYDSLGNHPSENMCSNGSTSMSLDPNQAKACHTLLSQACLSLQGRTCPCFDLLSLEDFTQDVLNQKIDFDAYHSCQTTDPNPSLYIHQQVQCITAPCPPVSLMQFAVETDPQMCIHKDAANTAQTMNDVQAMHCVRMLNRACQVIKEALPAAVEPEADPTPVMEGSDCADLPFYEYNNKDDLDCDWVAQDKTRRCRRFDDYAGNHVFENCRKTCGSCSCTDNMNLWGEDDMFDCSWVATNPKELCQYDLAMEHCRNTCGNCCKDNPNFKWWGDPYHTCVWVGGKPTLSETQKKTRLDTLCAYNAIAQNCPDTCNKCPTETVVVNPSESSATCPCFTSKDHLEPAVAIFNSGLYEQFSIQCQVQDGQRYIIFNEPGQPSNHPTMYGTSVYQTTEKSCFQDDMHWINTDAEFDACNTLLDNACAELVV